MGVYVIVNKRRIDLPGEVDLIHPAQSGDKVELIHRAPPTIQNAPPPSPKTSQIEIPQRVMIGAGDNIEDLLSKSP